MRARVKTHYSGHFAGKIVDAPAHDVEHLHWALEALPDDGDAAGAEGDGAEAVESASEKSAERSMTKAERRAAAKAAREAAKSAKPAADAAPDTSPDDGDAAGAEGDGADQPQA